MNEKYKFRAWNKHLKKMFYDVQNGITNSGLSDLISFREILEDNGDKWIVNQSMNLKDLNGKLIYEDDIMRFLPERTKAKKIGKNNHYYKVFINHKGNSSLDGINLNCQNGLFHSLDCHIVVGNIYENSELL